MFLMTGLGGGFNVNQPVQDRNQPLLEELTWHSLRYTRDTGKQFFRLQMSRFLITKKY